MNVNVEIDGAKRVSYPPDHGDGVEDHRVKDNHTQNPNEERE
jgi:hypothetical protein